MHLRVLAALRERTTYTRRSHHPIEHPPFKVFGYQTNPALPALMLFVLICVYLGLVFPPGKCCARKRWAGGVIDAQGNSACTRKTQPPLCPAPIPSPVKCLFVFYLICLVDLILFFWGAGLRPLKRWHGR